MTLESVVHQRIWLRDRDLRDTIDGPRRTMLGGARRLVDFTPRRRYAWYLTQDGWQHFSGMAEPGETLGEQFDSACGEIERGLAVEGRGWTAVTQARLFLERGQGEEGWLRDMLHKRAGLAADRIAFDWVDSLASTNKHLEIEAVARP